MPIDTDYAIIEIGMNAPGEIAPLARMARPDVAVVTTVAPAHLEAFGVIEGIAREKASIFEGLVPGGVALAHADVDTAPILFDKARAWARGSSGSGRRRTPPSASPTCACRMPDRWCGPRWRTARFSTSSRCRGGTTR
jgi:UDP-N-acetylmuramoyl-tripeptide--D-alanyl-D-alanine ligase